MKLATYRDGSRDGQLVVVSRDLSTAHYATGIATRLQQVLDDWNFLSPLLQDLSVTLNQGKARHAFAFEPRQCMAPLPRASQWAVAEAPPLLVQGASDDFLGPCSDAWFGAEAWGIACEPGLAVITGDVGMGASPEQGLDGVRLLMLANGWALRQLEAAERASGLGLLQSRPAAAFGPVAVTPDELGEAWQRGRVQGLLQTRCKGQPLGPVDAGAGMACHFGQLIAHLAKTRNLRAGAIVGSGRLGAPDAAPPEGLRFGDSVRIEMSGRDGQSVFGAIDQRITGPGHAAEAGLAEAGTAEADGTRPTGR